MKKLLAILLTMILALGTVCALAEDVTGTWYANMMGVTATLEVNPDGTLTLTMEGLSTSQGTWTVDGNRIIVDLGAAEKDILTLADGKLSNADTGIEFSREPAEDIALPAFVAAADASVFNGTWNVSFVSIGGFTLDIASAKEQFGEALGLGDNTTIVLDNGLLTLFGTQIGTLPFADGHLTAAGMLTIDLCEDGSIALTAMTEAGSMALYFTPAQ